MPFSLFPRRARILVAVLLLSLSSAACAPSVGDSCDSSADCPSGEGAICDNTAPDGYCLIPGCTPGSCPADSVCVTYDEQTSFCMEFCEEDRNCRSGYVCRTDQGPAGYCYVAP